VKGATGGKIPHIIDQISPDEVMFLINAIYFKGSWRLPFDRTRTTDAQFHLADGGTQPMRQMNMREHVRLQWTESFAAMELLYGNGAFAMDILMPGPGHGVNDVIDALTADEWDARMRDFHDKKAEVGLPKFKLEYERTLNDDLIALGMAVAFDPAAADFSRMVAGNNSPFISYVKQKTFVDVYEEGTAAAAATVVAVEVTSGAAMFIVDRPFVFVIRERLTGTILFVGKVVRIPGA
jgi:serpin B